MKNLFTLLIISILLVSCYDSKLDNPAKYTTKEIIDKSIGDTVTYKLVELNDDRYLINTDTQLVEYKFDVEVDHVPMFILGTCLAILLGKLIFSFD